MHFSWSASHSLLRLVLFALSLLLFTGCTPPSSFQDQIGESLRAPGLEAMQKALHQGKRWEKVHAAEFLISLDYREGVREVFEKEAVQSGSEPEYRIGIWRVLAQLDRHDRERGPVHVQNIYEVFADESSPDRTHAIESLAKLGWIFDAGPKGEEQQTQVRDFLAGSPAGVRPFVYWVLAQNGDEQAEKELRDLLKSDDEMARLRAAYVLRHFVEVTSETAQFLRKAYLSEDEASPSKIYLLTSVLRHPSALAPEEKKTLQLQLEQQLLDGTDSSRYEVTRLLADLDLIELPQLLLVQGNPNVSLDVRSSLGHAVCRMQRRQVPRMPWVDWMVVGLYGAGMLGVGVYYVRRNRTPEDYLLGGRRMRFWTVGLSLFATLLSTLSYLAWPGEMIKNGPIILMGHASYPIVFGVVGWLLIPKMMELNVTSGYEILEKRLGLSIRLLGSTLFLSLRFLWMASIIYWTTAIVLLPAAGLDASYAPWFAALLGIVTVIYTSLGGLRAVVVTDVIQTFILILGAVTALTIITLSLGGVGAWIPDQWVSHWPAPRLWFDFQGQARSTLANAMLATFCWYVCTAGSDQMAIQRYLATRDVKAARRTLATSMLTDVTVLLILAMMGLGLLAFFQAHPELMADGQTVYQNADKLFPRFVVVGLPIGFSGLVIAGLLAAAMSSLSSGVNSSAAVITEDFVRRLHPREDQDQHHMKQVRWSSILVGIVAVLLSALIGNVQGNMFEVVYKVVNLFVAPLFFLFFMAIFIPWANPAGTWCGALVGIATAVLIAFWKDLLGSDGISFLWIMPASFTAAASVGMAVSRFSSRP